MAESQTVRLRDIGRKWETLSVRREVHRGLGKLQVCEGKPAEGERSRPRPGLGENVGKCKSGLQEHRGPQLRKVRHLVSEGLGGSGSEHKMPLGLV